MKDTPLHYEVELVYWDDATHKFIKISSPVFKNENPIIARCEAFKEYIEMENWIATGNGVMPQDLVNNASILHKQFSISGKEADVLKYLSAEDFIKFKNSLGLSVFLVLDKDIDEEDVKDRRYIIHGLYNSCYLDYWENLFFEMDFYNHFECDTGGKEVEVTIFVADILENDYETEVILDTPLDWSQYRHPDEEYIESVKNLERADEDEIHSLEKSRKKITDLTLEDLTAEYISELISNGENEVTEFKSSLVYNFKSQRGARSIIEKNAKAICSFLNTKGGVLIIGIRDDKDSGEGYQVQGLEKSDFSIADKTNRKDWVHLQFAGLVTLFIGAEYSTHIESKFVDLNDKLLFCVLVYPYFDDGVYLRRTENQIYSEHFYIRIGPSSHEVKGEEKIKRWLRNRKQ